MAKFSKINSFCDRAMARMDELGDEALRAMRNTPEAKARQALNAEKRRAYNARLDAKYAAGRAAAVATAAAFSIGQTVRTMRGEIATVVGIEGSAVALSNGKRFAATTLTAA